MAEARKYLQKFMGFFWEGVRCGASQVLLVVKNLPANTGDTRDAGSIPGSGRFPGGGNGKTAIHSSVLAWRTPWTEQLGGLQSMG